MKLMLQMMILIFYSCTGDTMNIKTLTLDELRRFALDHSEKSFMPLTVDPKHPDGRRLGGSPVQ